MTFDDVVKEVHRIVRQKDGKSVQELALKTAEEVGELAEAVLSITGAHGCSYKKKNWDDVDEEAVDVIICALATALKGTETTERLIEIFEKKLKKWEGLFP